MAIDEILKELDVLRDMQGSSVYDSEAAIIRIMAAVSALQDEQPNYCPQCHGEGEYFHEGEAQECFACKWKQSAANFKSDLLAIIYPHGIKHPQQVEEDSILHKVKELVDSTKRELGEIGRIKRLEEHHHITESYIGRAKMHMKNGNWSFALKLLNECSEKINALLPKIK